MFTLYVDVDFNFIKNIYRKFTYNDFDSFLKYNRSAITFRHSLSESSKLSITQQIKALPAFKKYCFYQSYTGCYISLLMDILTGEHYDALKQHYNYQDNIQGKTKEVVKGKPIIDQAFNELIKESVMKNEISIKLSKVRFTIPKITGRSIYNDMVCSRYCSPMSIIGNIQKLSEAELIMNMHLYLNYIKRNMAHNHITHNKLPLQINCLNISISLRRSFCVYHLLSDFNLYPPDIRLISLKVHLLVIVVCMNIIQGMEADICYIVRSFEQNWKHISH
jgi:hypothetical protein